MKIEYNKEKSEKNKEKHGINFAEGMNLWNDQDRIIIPAKSEDESRYAIIAKYKDKIWTGFYTLRGPQNEMIRIISIRRSRTKETELYESETIR
jgi:uncharacterized protein